MVINLKNIYLIGYTFLLTAIGYLIFGKDLLPVLIFFGGFILFSLGSIPVAFFLFKKFDCRGYIFGKAIGFAVCGYVVYILCLFKIFEFSRTLIFCIYGLYVIFLYVIWLFQVLRKQSFKELVKRKKSIIIKSIVNILKQELFLLTVFIFFTWILNLKIPSYSTERLMDFGIMKTIYNSSYFPPEDMWASGINLNYYYFGHFLWSFFCKFCGVSIEQGYTLAIDMTGSLTFCFCYYIVKEMLLQNKVSGFTAKTGGILSGIFVAFSGNLHYVIFSKIAPAIWDILGIQGEKPSYWFSNSTRYIGYMPYVEQDRTIHEFPFYALLVGDLHAHVIDMIIVLTVLALGISYVYRDNKDCIKAGFKLLDPYIFAFGFLISVSLMTNYWDFPIYSVITIVMLTLFSIKNGKTEFKYLIIKIIEIFVLVFICSLPFRINFVKMENGIAFSRYHTKIYQLLILWGLPIALLTVFLIREIKNKFRKTNNINSEKCWKQTIKNTVEGIAGYCSKNISDSIALVMGICAAGLIIIPEIIYVRDIYESGFPRANTMFKLTYQAFIILGVTSAYIFCRLVKNKKTIILFLLYLWCTTYSYSAIKQWVGSGFYFKGLDSTATILEELGEESRAISFIKENIDSHRVILQAPGKSYTSYNAVSALTGNPTVAGWETHEWLWQNSYDFISARQQDVDTIYTSKDINTIKDLIDKYNIDYIYIGKSEFEKYNDKIDVGFILTLGQIVYIDNGDINPVILIEIDKQNY